MGIKDQVYEELLCKALEFITEEARNYKPSKDSGKSFNENLHISDDLNIAFKIHKNMIATLSQIYINNVSLEHANKLSKILLSSNKFNLIDIVQDSIEYIPELCEKLHINFLNSQYYFENDQVKKKKSKHYLKNNGAVYTPENIVDNIVSTCLKNSSKNNDIGKGKYLDFASGTGRFYFVAIKLLHKKYNISYIDSIVNNLYAIDVDAVAVSIVRLKAISLCDRLSDEIIHALESNIICKNALHVDDFFMNININIFDIQKNQKTTEVFDAIFSNPPFLILKINKKNNSSELRAYYDRLQQKINTEISFYKDSGLYTYSIQGMLNYYQISIEAIIKFCKKNGQIGIICPSSLFGDASTEKLRRHLLEDNRLMYVKFYPEKEKLFDNVTQATSVFFIEKQGITKKIRVSLPSNDFDINYKDVKNNFPNRLELPAIDKISWSILSKLSKQLKLKDISAIRNRRGELDLSLYKEYIVSQNTGYHLIRGNMITRDGINRGLEFVNTEDFIKKKSDDYLQNDFENERLICQQISNTSKEKRLNFVWCKKTDIIANSCNYIAGEIGTLKLMNIILNSSLLNWRFKITSTNNHINNYELDDLPIINIDNFDINEFSGSFEDNDLKICKLYGLSEKEAQYITKKYKNPL